MKRHHWILACCMTMLPMSAALSADKAPAGVGNERFAPRIIGGNDAPDDKYPFMATVQLTELGDNAYDRHWCGGSLISPYFVLTAAHCVTFFESGDLSVIVGRTSLRNERQGEKSNVAAIYVHPKYNNDQAYDVAVLALSSPITSVAPVELVTPGTDALERPGRILTNIGWGNIVARNPSVPGEDSVQPNRLNEVGLPVVSFAECLFAYEGVDRIREGLDLCAGRAGKDACQGDSGGPLFVAVPGTKRYIQVGTVSRGLGCGAAGFPGVFTRLANKDIADFIATPWGAGSPASALPVSAASF